MSRASDAHIGAFAAFGDEFGVIGIGDVNEGEASGFRPGGPATRPSRRRGRGRRRARLSTLIAEKLRRHLLDGAGVARQQRLDRLARWPLRAGRNDLAVGVVGVARLAPAHGEAVGLAAVHHERNGLGRLAERDRQAAGGERVERAGVAGALRLEQPLAPRSPRGSRSCRPACRARPSRARRASRGGIVCSALILPRAGV